MCGLIAAFTYNYFPEDSARRALFSMQNRGPDGEDFWRGEGVYLAHRRLAVIDLDFRASQPLKSPCERYLIIFNGEIYNFKELRADLINSGIIFFTDSDTEVLLNLFIIHKASMLNLLKGMFSFVIWDNVEKIGFAARDPYGIKPLYFSANKFGLILASQVKALIETGLVSKAVDEFARENFLMLGSVPEPHSWFEEIKPLLPGHYIEIKDCKISKTVFWNDILNAWRNSDGFSKQNLNLAYIKRVIKESIRESVKRHLVSDVPIGIFLSGGLDSAVLAGLTRELSDIKLLGITISYDEFKGKSDDEVPAAKIIADYYGIKHYIKKVTANEFYNDLPRIFNAMDQPTIDGINTWYASKAASECGLKVAISGLGGDELFLGYASFGYLPKLVRRWKKFRKIPLMLYLIKFLLFLIYKAKKNRRWLHASDWLENIEGAWWLRRSINTPKDIEMFFNVKKNSFLEKFSPVLWFKDRIGLRPENNLIALAQIENATYLRNQLLRDSDWASMDFGVELRAPLVDSFLLEKITPYIHALSHFPKKALLTDSLNNPLPKEILNRKKTGFGIPIKSWVNKKNTNGKNCNNWNLWIKLILKNIYA